MDKKRQMAFNLNNFLLSFSQALDAVETDIYGVNKNHSKRVAYIALKFAVEFNYEAKGLFDICAYSLCHNIALVQSEEKGKNYCELSNEYSKKLPFLTNEGDILKYQCEHYDGSGIYGLKGEEFPLFSQFIAFADIIDTKFDLSKSDIENRVEILKFVKANENILFSEDLVECFEEFSTSTSFWLDLQNENELLSSIFSNLQDFSTVLDFEEILEITSIFTNMIELNSDIISLSKKVTEFYNFDHKDTQVFLIASSLTNIGKLFIPRDILNKKDSLDNQEYELIKSYPYYTKKILSNVIGFGDIITLTSKVQERVDGSGYPYNLTANSLSFKDRLLACIVIYNSLTSQKKYRKAYSHNEAIEIMKKEALNNKIDESILNDFEDILK